VGEGLPVPVRLGVREGLGVPEGDAPEEGEAVDVLDVV
jgi:hypothetical protein